MRIVSKVVGGVGFGRYILISVGIEWLCLGDGDVLGLCSGKIVWLGVGTQAVILLCRG